MSTQKVRIIATVIGLLALVAFVSGLFIAQHVHFKKKIDASLFHGTWLEKPRDVSAFSLLGIDNKPFTKESLQGQWTMVFFGFTNCGYVCPTTMAELGKMYRMLAAKGVTTLPNIVMISIDPERDNLDKLNYYVKSFDSHFYGARGESDMIKQMTREMGIAYAKVALKGKVESQNYDIQHSGAVMLFNPQGKLNAFFTKTQAKELTDDYLLLVS